MKSRTSLKMGHVGSKTKSVGQMLEKSVVRSRGHIFNEIIMKLCQNFCLHKISDEYKNGSCWVENSVTRSNLRKACVCYRGQIFCRILMKLGLDEIFYIFLKWVMLGPKSRSLGQIIKDPMLVIKGL